MNQTLTSLESHPCFGLTARKMFHRLHLPVAPRANARLAFDTPGKPPESMMPVEAVAWLDRVLSQGKPVSVVGIAGPGDPLAVPGPTLETLRLVRAKYPDMTLCLTSLCLGGAEHAAELAELKLSHVTVMVDAVDPAVLEKLYAWIRPGRKTVPLAEASKILVEEQARAVTAFKEAGLTVKINTRVFPGYNEDHVEAVAKAMADLGADIMAVIPYQPEGDDSPLAEVDTELLEEVRDRACKFIQLMPAWSECTDDDRDEENPGAADLSDSVLPRATEERPNVAVVSSTGRDIDMHLGQAIQALIYGPREDGLVCLLGSRALPEPGTGSQRWVTVSKALHDCFALLTASAGNNPRQILGKSGLSVLITDGEIDGTVDVLYGGGKKGKCRK